MLNIKPAHSSISSSALNHSVANTIVVNTIPLALYIHIPWCVKKCPYCDFNSHELPIDSQSLMYDEYVDALLLDAKVQQTLTQGRKISSIFIGGGTPSLLPIAQYQRLFAGLRACFDFSADIEVTMEANPGTLEHAPFAQYLDVGINRLSIGVQSFAADKLKTLGRIHDPAQALAAIHAARTAGFERVNVDLMHGLPQQTMHEALDDIQMAHDAGATHISWYQLTIEPNTVFYRSQPVLPDEDNLADIEQAGQALLQKLGYNNYEVSAWSGASDKPCRHNVNYWQFGDYLAIGAGAHGKLTVAGKATELNGNELLLDSGIYRFSKSRLPKDYVNYQDISHQDMDYQADAEQSTLSQSAPKMVGWQVIDSDELVSEFMLNALRLHDGVMWSLFEARTGLRYSDIAEQVDKLVVQGLLVDSAEHLQPTKLGQRYLNQILRVFL
ncbi:radical SAM family heme chaperone HemW [Psychrobacter sp. AOP22-C1-22]|uniref:radical SAM family heme chaperone HemW n=1 Tax=unclassified Psychrobacter TaxID=196806 RepID=UPI001788039E|nr:MULTISPECIES: radical SAM family heme chaperone HemW [unclassified Psychrobacter]MBE0406158.1 radical SAM family heme chaperone HemW [Psychrobacter sp. FME6]MBE0443828.1 radical SAM family heme chaperone HemW [Psychrobacter sp. FME5]MDN5802089.1 radical SAM family heme chaperone HemW [Psychrobacter sp.]MDN5892112.1 radical SAM family heme chaperone HemW [Psychrobacter sp.]